MLAGAFEAHPGPIVFTSATLTTGQGFAYLRDRIGLQADAAEAIFASPFSFEQQALLYLACDLPDPDTAGFAAAAAARLHELCVLSRGRALLLHTSFRNLRVTEATSAGRAAFPGSRASARATCCCASCATGVGSCCWPPRASGRASTFPARRCRSWPWTVALRGPDDPLTAARIARSGKRAVTLRRLPLPGAGSRSEASAG